MNAIRRIGCSLIFAIGMCVFAGFAMAADFRELIRQKQIENGERPADPVAQPASNSQKTADATAPNSAVSAEPLELKGIKIGMTAQELLKLHPQLKIKITKPLSNKWILGDMYFYTTPQEEPGLWSLHCEQVGGNRNDNPCTPVTLMEVPAFLMKTIFVDNKLASASISYPRFKGNDIHFYAALLEGLTAKFKVSPTISDKTNGPEEANTTQYKVAGWRNNSCKCQLILFEEDSYNKYGSGFVTIKWEADGYKNVVEDRTKKFTEFVNNAEAQENAKKKGDL